MHLIRRSLLWACNCILPQIQTCSLLINPISPREMKLKISVRLFWPSKYASTEHTVGTKRHSHEAFKKYCWKINWMTDHNSCGLSKIFFFFSLTRNRKRGVVNEGCFVGFYFFEDVLFLQFGFDSRSSLACIFKQKNLWGIKYSWDWVKNEDDTCCQIHKTNILLILEIKAILISLERFVYFPSFRKLGWLKSSVCGIDNSR